MQNQDERFGRLLREDAPAERDALFRISVLERRERMRFRQRSLVMILGAAVVAAALGTGFAAGLDLLAATAVAFVIAGLATAFVFSVPGVFEVRRRLGNRKSAERS